VTHDQEEALSISDRIVVMNTGRMEQVGSPVQIYNYPTTPFVASFIGQLNLLPVVVEDPTAGAVSLGKAGGPVVRTAQPIKLPSGSATKLAVRPEELKVEELAAGEIPSNGVNRLNATVQSVTFLGAIVRMRVALAALDAGPQLSVDLFNDRRLVLPRQGEQVNLVFPPDACWVSEASTA